MTTQQVANRLVELCRQGKNEQAIEELYGKDIVSVEPFGDESMPAEMRGIDAIRGKTKWWMENHIVHSGKVSDPIVAGGHFAVAFHYDITAKAKNQRMQIEEIALYEVKNGKIVREQFFYSM